MLRGPLVVHRYCYSYVHAYPGADAGPPAPKYVPLANNTRMKGLLVLPSIAFGIAVLITEYWLNPHTVAHVRFPTLNETADVLVPPCIAVEPYIGYNIFLLGIPIAIFLHVKLAIFNLYGHLGLVPCMEAAYVLIVLSFNEIRSFHTVDCMLLLCCALCIFYMLDNGASEGWRRLFFAAPVLAVAIGVGCFIAWANYDPSQMNTPVSLAYIFLFGFWILSQWMLIYSSQVDPASRLDTWFGGLNALAVAATVVTIYLMPELFYGNAIRPWEAHH